MTPLIYTSFKNNVLSGRIDLLGHTIKALLVTDAYRPDAKHSKLADVKGEAEGMGYTPGGLPLINKRIEGGAFKAAEMVWQKASVSATGVVLYKAGDKENLLIAYLPFDKEITSTNGAFALAWAKEGIFGL